MAAKVMDAVIAALLAMALACIAVARAIALGITVLVGIIMRCITLRPAKSIVAESNTWQLSQRKSPQNAIGELTTCTEKKR